MRLRGICLTTAWDAKVQAGASPALEFHCTPGHRPLARAQRGGERYRTWWQYCRPDRPSRWPARHQPTRQEPVERGLSGQVACSLSSGSGGESPHHGSCARRWAARQVCVSASAPADGASVASGASRSTRSRGASSRKLQADPETFACRGRQRVEVEFLTGEQLRLDPIGVGVPCAVGEDHLYRLDVVVPPGQRRFEGRGLD
jgi:hypothetical protein